MAEYTYGWWIIAVASRASLSSLVVEPYNSVFITHTTLEHVGCLHLVRIFCCPFGVCGCDADDDFSS
jgi:hypothetical protein